VSRPLTVLLWAGLLVAFSPVLVDLSRHLFESPWARYVLPFPLLFLRCALRETDPRPRRRDGLLWIAGGLLLELFAAFSGTLRFGRIGIALALIGLCRLQGFPGVRAQLLLLFSVPIPAWLVRIAHPVLPGVLLQAVAAGLGVFGIDAQVVGNDLVLPSLQLQLDPMDSGLQLAPLLAGLVWYDSILVGRRLPEALLRSSLAAALAIPLQTLAITLVLAFLDPSSDPALGQRLLQSGTWVAVAATFLSWSELRLRRTASA